jgi:hypothetical protein
MLGANNQWELNVRIARRYGENTHSCIILEPQYSEFDSIVVQRVGFYHQLLLSPPHLLRVSTDVR